MSESGKPRKTLEEVAKLKGKGATKEEMQAAAFYARQVADDNTTTLASRSVAARYADELSRNQDDVKRRDELMSGWTAAAQRLI